MSTSSQAEKEHPKTAQSSTLDKSGELLGGDIHGPELVVGFVGAVGVELRKAEDDFEARLKIIGFKVVRISVASSVIPSLVTPSSGASESEYARISRMMDAGNRARQRSKDPGFLALGVAAEIAKNRPSGPSVANGTAYLIHSLKHPEEVRRLRETYPRGFLLVGVHASRERRIQYLKNDRRMSETEALSLMERDMKEEDDWGQRLVDTFHLSDFFIRIERSDDRLKNSIWRIVDLIFGNPFITPNFSEYAMFLAFAASLRSADLSRQVGAVIANEGEILATGANDCPRAGGGLYWPSFNEKSHAIEDHPNGRDFVRGFDSNKAEQQEIIEEIIEIVGGNRPAKEKLRKALTISPIKDLTEFGRVVHAEMEALLSCARKGISTRDAAIYCTTFPCHNCAKHLIAAEIKRIVFVEPYLKSKAFKLHDDALVMTYGEEAEQELQSEAKVLFEPFVGVGPRRFFDLFSLGLV
jgi:deoxycytidylate deaminase